ncbi:hypothetical protein CFOL_v3_06342, partial [Cephalotus follicularis]
TTISFKDDDLQPGTLLHNSPFYMSGYIRDHEISSMLVGDGSVVNIMPIRTMKKIGIILNELSRSKLLIQCFNQNEQKEVGEIVSSSIFHVIDAKTSYELLMERAWLHQNGVIALTWHQCFKHIHYENEICVVTEREPFNKESYYADAKFYLENE